MGKAKNRSRGEALPFTLRFEPPSGRAGAGGAGAGGAAGGNPLRELFPEADRDLLDEVFVSAGRDVEAATAMVLEILAPAAAEPALSPHRPPSPPGGAAHGGRARAGEPVIDLLPHDMLLKLFGSSRFRPVDLLVCASCCRVWRQVIGSIMQSIKQLDLCHSSDRMNLALLNCCRNAEVVRIRGAFHSFMQLPRTHLGARGRTQTLANLKLVCCANLTDDMVVGMLTSMPGLVSMELDSCELVTDGAFCSLWEHRMKIDFGEIAGSPHAPAPPSPPPRPRPHPHPRTHTPAHPRTHAPTHPRTHTLVQTCPQP